MQKPQLYCCQAQTRLIEGWDCQYPGSIVWISQCAECQHDVPLKALVVKSNFSWIVSRISLFNVRDRYQFPLLHFSLRCHIQLRLQFKRWLWTISESVKFKSWPWKCLELNRRAAEHVPRKQVAKSSSGSVWRRYPAPSLCVTHPSSLSFLLCLRGSRGRFPLHSQSKPKGWWLLVFEIRRRIFNYHSCLGFQMIKKSPANQVLFPGHCCQTQR